MVTDKTAESVGGESAEMASTTETAPDIGDGDGTDESVVSTTEDVDDVQGASLSLDVTFEILRNRRRQMVLEFLRDREETVTIGELAEHIAAIENDTTVRQLNAQQRKRVYIGLYQCHLPKMDDVDVIDFNQSRGRIEPGKHIEPLYEYLDVANGDAEDADDADDAPFERKHGAGFAVATVAFFGAQLSGAHVVASAVVVLMLLATLVVTYDTG